MLEVSVGLLVIAVISSLVAIQIRCYQLDKAIREFQEEYNSRQKAQRR